MSTHWYYECQSHDPPLQNEIGVNHGQNGLADLLEIIKQIPELEWPLELYITVNGYKEPAEFLSAHRNCHVLVKSEYGDYWINRALYTPPNGRRSMR